MSRIEGLVSIIHYIKEKEKETSLLDYYAERVKAIDREWLEQQIYGYTEEDRVATLSPANQLARVAELHRNETSCAGIVLLGEADYCTPLMAVPPFPPFEPGRQHKETELFRFSQQPNNASPARWVFERHYMGTFSAKSPLPPRQPAPVRSHTAHTLESAQRGPKRPRSSTSEEVS